MTQQFDCGCSCGEVEFTISSKPLFRGYCHCTICQRFNDAPYADITVFTADNLDACTCVCARLTPTQRKPNKEFSSKVSTKELASVPVLCKASSRDPYKWQL